MGARRTNESSVLHASVARSPLPPHRETQAEGPCFFFFFFSRGQCESLVAHRGSTPGAPPPGRFEGTPCQCSAHSSVPGGPGCLAPPPPLTIRTSPRSADSRTAPRGVAVSPTWIDPRAGGEAARRRGNAQDGWPPAGPIRQLDDLWNAGRYRGSSRSRRHHPAAHADQRPPGPRGARRIREDLAPSTDSPRDGRDRISGRDSIRTAESRSRASWDAEISGAARHSALAKSSAQPGRGIRSQDGSGQGMTRRTTPRECSRPLLSRPGEPCPLAARAP